MRQLINEINREKVLSFFSLYIKMYSIKRSHEISAGDSWKILISSFSSVTKEGLTKNRQVDEIPYQRIAALLLVQKKRLYKINKLQAPNVENRVFSFVFLSSFFFSSSSFPLPSSLLALLGYRRK